MLSDVVTGLRLHRYVQLHILFLVHIVSVDLVLKDHMSIENHPVSKCHTFLPPEESDKCRAAAQASVRLESAPLCPVNATESCVHYRVYTCVFSCVLCCRL